MDPGRCVIARAKKKQQMWCMGSFVIGERGHVRIAKVQHTLAKAVHSLGCLYLVIIMSNYSRFIVPVKKLQFSP